MKSTTGSIRHTNPKVILSSLTLAWILWSAGSVSRAQAPDYTGSNQAPSPAPTDASSDAPDATQPTGPTQVPPHDGSQAPPPDTSQPEINYDYFHDQLAPFGTWISIDDTMYWRPDAAINANPDWRPYYDMGQWVQTDNGLFWESDYTWGDIPFHYGRWVQDPTQGWLWAPDYTWGPSWVFWRQAGEDEDGTIGWAPLPPGAVFVDGRWFYHGAYFALDYDFGLGDGYFVFVGYGHFHDKFFRMRGREYHYNFDRGQVHGLYARSTIKNSFRMDKDGIHNEGIGRDKMERYTKVAHAGFQVRSPVGDRNRLAAQTQAVRPHSYAAHSQPSTFQTQPYAVHTQPATFQAQPYSFRGQVSNVYKPSVTSSRSSGSSNKKK